MPTYPTMQEVIRRLDDYWTAQGCTNWQPYSEKVGAGTMNPATILRVLGPEPWNVAYVEPSFRADDGRYAENPNRMQMHHQYQVILKPDPGNPQELYLGSLAAIGLDRTRHDIRFVEDNWQSPALGAWGLGWEVWLDGQEITQYTYFQQAGGLQLDPVSVEITYGLDRIVMYLQNKSQVWDIDVDGTHTFAQVYRPAEIEHCVYNFELADVERLKQLYAIYQAEADACIARGLVIPAHDFVLRQSHTFNLLDARGAIGVTERAKFFADMRNQARSVSELYIAQRQDEEYPWLPDNSADGKAAVATVVSEDLSEMTEATDFLLELGSEELPPEDVTDGIAQIEKNLTILLAENNLQHNGIKVTGTTRRLVAHVAGLAPNQPDEVVEKRGPAVDRAFDEQGAPTRAAEGFARGQGVDVADLEVRDGYIYAIRRVEGRPTSAVLPDICTQLLDGLRWHKTMRWNSSNVGFPRPLRWILALYGGHVVPFSWAGVMAGRASRGSRFADAAANLADGEFTMFETVDAGSYFDSIRNQGIVLDRDQRRTLIATAVQKAASTVGGYTPEDDDLLDEVTDLVEAPEAVLGSFSEESLALPMPLLIAVMKKHQRYFPIFKKGGNEAQIDLLPNFVTVANSNGLAHPDVVRSGNEGVIRARYSDAAFFFRQDTARAFADFTPRLDTLTFHAKLGSMLDKVKRLEALAPQLYPLVGGSETGDATIKRAAALAKSDLVTAMVVEMTSLQGTMGEIYALKSGEDAAVARAISEHYLPRKAGDDAPRSVAGLALGLADKLDSLLGLFAVGAMPTGSADPFGLRRAGLGIVNNLLERKVDFSVRAALRLAASLQPVEIDAEMLNTTAEFVQRRLQGVLGDRGYRHDIIEAVLPERGDNPYAAQLACEHLTELTAQSWWADALTAFARTARITRNLEERFDLNAAAYEEQVEQTLHDAYLAAVTTIADEEEPAVVLGSVIQELATPINDYFENVMVNAEEPRVRAARLGLLQQIAALPVGIADVSKLRGF